MSTQKSRAKEAQEPYPRMTLSFEEEADPETVRRAFAVAERGTDLRRVKLGSPRSPHSVKLSADHQHLIYKTSDERHACSFLRGKKAKEIPVSMLIDVRSGWNTDRFIKAATKDDFNTSVNESCCFSVIFRKLHHLQKSIDFVAESPDSRQVWLIVLQKLLNDIRSAALHFNEKTWLRRNFETADANNNGKLSFRELWELLKKLSVQISEKECRRQFTLSDFRKTDESELPALDFEEFVLFFRSLTRRPELKKVMREFSGQGIDLWTAEDLNKFLEQSQGFRADVNECKSIIQEFEPDDETRKEGNLSVHGFRLLLLSKWGSIMKPLHAHTVFQDMNQPLCSYFIHSTHNTYLLGHQLHGDASIEGYIRALKSGARMLELDIWEGKDEPIVTHGYTLVNPQTLASVVRAIDTYAFRTSPYPLILSLENHCGMEMQARAAHIFAKVFGEKIYVPPRSQKVLPSPEALKNKILLKCKKLADSPESQTNEEEDEFFDDVYDAVFDDTWSPEQMDVPAAKNTIKTGDMVLPVPEVSPKIQAAAKRKTEKVPIAKELSDLVALKSVKFKDVVKDVDNHPFNSHSSLAENKGRDICAKQFEMLVYYTANHLTKVYPSGKRISSANFHPMEHWIAGVHNVTMNAQTAGEEMDLNLGMFAINNACGYALKPKWMREDFASLNYRNFERRLVQMVLKIQIISGQCLPRPDTKYTDSIVDPYVTLEVYGFPFDSIKYRTEVVKANGFNPVWNSDHFVINLRVPELALVRFSVKDFDRLSANDFVGQYTIPAMSITPGYGTIPLLTGTGHTSDPSAALFIHVQTECKINDEQLCNLV